MTCDMWLSFLISESMSNKDVCITALAKLGLLMIPKNSYKYIVGTDEQIRKRKER